ncbi:MAG: hypothetical protein HND58_01885 [Planctomycetota bacterium]|nr:MAG: hypothetical protein HND58_01885 [Planctomycetota bacterium]
MTTRVRRITILALGTLAAAAVTGCSTASSNADYAQAERIRADLTPELDTLYQRPDDMSNAFTVMLDENGRMIWQDLGRVLYTDRPSRLTREPVPW